jgi:hypothetical protein
MDTTYYSPFTDGLVTKQVNSDGAITNVIIDLYKSGETITLNNVQELLELLIAIQTILKEE